MKAELRRLARGSLIYGVGSVFQRFLSLLLLPFFTRVLSPQEYGVMALISLMTVAIVALFNLGTGSSMGILYFEREDAGERHRVVWSTVCLLVGNCAVLLSLLCWFAPAISALVFETSEYANLMRLAFVSTALVRFFFCCQNEAHPIVCQTFNNN